MSDLDNATVAVETENTQSVENTETTEASVNESENTDQTEAKEGEEGYIPFPKKAVNAISRRDKTIAKLQARQREMEAQLTQFMQMKQSSQETSGRPKEDDYQTYGDYLKADILWEAKQHLAESQKAQKETENQSKITAEQQQYIMQRAKDIDVKSAQYSTSIPDFDEVQDMNVDIVANLPRHVQMAMLECDDPALAFYNLAKDGNLADLANMTPTRAAMVIALAANKQPSKPTQAPKPLRGATGTGQSASSLNAIAKDPDAIMKWLQS